MQLHPALPIPPLARHLPSPPPADARPSPPPSYGFITFATLAEAEKAVQTLDKQTVGERQINVELAKPGSATPREPRVKREPRIGGETAVNENGETVAGEETKKKRKARVSGPFYGGNGLLRGR